MPSKENCDLMFLTRIRRVCGITVQVVKLIRRLFLCKLQQMGTHLKNDELFSFYTLCVRYTLL